MIESVEAPASQVAPSVEVQTGDAYDLIAKLEDNSVDLLITSPPYWGLRTYGQEHNEEILEEWRSTGALDTAPPSYEWYRENGGILGMEPIPEWFIFHLVEIFERGAHALKPSASMWINIGDTYFARWSSIRHDGRQGLGNNPRGRRRVPMGGYRQEKQLLLVPARFAITMQERRWILRNDLIWHKPNIPPRPEKDRLRASHEHFFHFVKRQKEGRPKYYYDIHQVEPGARDVVTVNVASGQDGHSATFPLDLIRPRILSSCPKGGNVLDPFCGTGRSLSVAAASGRNAIGFDLSGTFAEAAARNSQAARKSRHIPEDREFEDPTEEQQESGDSLW